MPEELSSLKLPDWLKPDGLRICSLKTYPDCLTITKDGRLRLSSGRLTSWGTAWNGLCITAPISESRSSGEGCSLSDILIPDAPEKYFLSSEQMENLLFKSSEAGRGNVSMTREGLPVLRRQT